MMIILHFYSEIKVFLFLFLFLWRCSASAMYTNFGDNNFETTIRKSTYRLDSLIMTIEKSWKVRIDVWKFYRKKI